MDKKLQIALGQVSKIRPGGHKRHVEPSHPACQGILSIMKKIYNDEKFIHLVECDTYRNNRVMLDVRPANYCVIAYVVL